MCFIGFYSMMTLKEKEKVETQKNLGEFEAGDMLEITTLDIVKGKDGNYGIAQYALATKKKNRKDSGKVIIPNRLMENDNMRCPLVLVYFGTKPNKKGQKYYATKTYGCESLKEMKKQQHICETWTQRIWKSRQQSKQSLLLRPNK